MGLGLIASIFSSPIFEPIKRMYQGIWDSILAIIKFAINGIIGHINRGIKGFNTLIDGANSIAKAMGGSEITWRAGEIPTLAKGSLDFAGGLARVGENGPENVVLPKGSKVIPSGQSSQNKNVTINNYFPPETDMGLYSSRMNYLINRIA